MCGHTEAETHNSYVPSLHDPSRGHGFHVTVRDAHSPAAYGTRPGRACQSCEPFKVATGVRALRSGRALQVHATTTQHGDYSARRTLPGRERLGGRCKLERTRSEPEYPLARSGATGTISCHWHGLVAVVGILARTAARADLTSRYLSCGMAGTVASTDGTDTPAE